MEGEINIEKLYVQEILESVVRQSYAQVVWSHKIQEKQADIYLKKYMRMETTRIILASITSAGILSTIFYDSLFLKILSAILSFGTVFISAYSKSFDLKTLIEQHKASANSILLIREKLYRLLTKIKMDTSEIDTLYTSYEQIMENLALIYTDAPSTSDKAVKLASKSLTISEDNTFSDEEIDKYLPEKLRKES